MYACMFFQMLWSPNILWAKAQYMNGVLAMSFPLQQAAKGRFLGELWVLWASQSSLMHNTVPDVFSVFSSP